MAIKETIPFSFQENYDYISQKFVDAGYDVQEGSNTMQLVTAMSYLTSMLNANTAVNVNETVLTLARKRNNILQDARILGYEIAHRLSYQYKLLLVLPAGNFILPKYAEFTSGSYKYYYMGDQIELNDIPEGYELEITVKEGILRQSTNEETLNVTITDILENGETIPQYYVDVPFVNVEEEGIEVFLTYYDEFGTLFQREEWSKSEQFMIDKDTVLNKQFVRLDEIAHKTPRLYFKLGDVGQDLRTGTIVEMNILESSGSLGEMTDTPKTTLDCEIASYTLKLQGADEETEKSIKLNAPLFHNSANRAITKSDYIAIANRHQAVNFSQVWDGDDEYPKVPGNIWFSFKPSTNIRNFSSDVFNKTYSLDNPTDLINWYIEDSEIRSPDLTDKGVWDVIDAYKVPTLEFNHRHPIYIDFEYDVNVVRYNVKTSEADINNEIFTVIDNFFRGINEDTAVETFEFEYFQSNLNKRIDKYLTDITGFNINLTTSTTLTNKNIIQEKENYKDVYIHLDMPFEDVFDNDGNLITANLPNIETLDFLNGNDLTLDFSTLVGNEKDEKIIDINILLNNDVVGNYRIFNNGKRYILVNLFVLAADSTYTTGIDESSVDNLKLNIAYPSPNIRFMRNSLPRLKTIQFK